MHALLIHQAFVKPDEGGGTRHFEFGRHLVRAGDRFTIVASQVNYLTGKRSVAKRALIVEEAVEGVKVLRAYTFPALHTSFVWRIIAFLGFMVTSVVASLRVPSVDLVVGTSPPLFQAISAWLVAACRRKPLLLEIRDLWPEFAIDMGVLKNPALIWLSRWLESFLYRRADHFLVNSPAYQTYLTRKGIPESRITLIPNGVDPGMFDPSGTGEAVRKEFNLNGYFVVVYAGALGLANDIPTLLRTAHRLRSHQDIKFLLVGDGKERPRLEQTSREMDLPNVVFVGARPKCQISDFLAASDACVALLKNIPMFKTTYPNKVFDYMAAARPTVLAIDGVIREVMESAGGGIYASPGDDVALANAILELKENPAQAHRMGQSAREYATRFFNRQTHCLEFVQLLERLAALRSN